jgi:hypothetical protein
VQACRMSKKNDIPSFEFRRGYYIPEFLMFDGWMVGLAAP